MTTISTHILDLALGRPAAGIEVTLERADTAGHFKSVGRGTTDADGRIASFGGADATASRYRLNFLVEPYFMAQNIVAFFPEVEVLFAVREGDERCHVPLLLSPFGYSTYRGS